MVRIGKSIRWINSLKDELERILSIYHKNSLNSIAAIEHLLDIANEKLLNEAGPIQDLVHKVVASVKKNLQLYWSKKEDARAAIRLAITRIKGKVPFSELDRLLKDVTEKTEDQYSEWPMVG